MQSNDSNQVINDSFASSLPCFSLGGERLEVLPTVFLTCTNTHVFGWNWVCIFILTCVLHHLSIADLSIHQCICLFIYLVQEILPLIWLFTQLLARLPTIILFPPVTPLPASQYWVSETSYESASTCSACTLGGRTCTWILYNSTVWTI